MSDAALEAAAAAGPSGAAAPAGDGAPLAGSLLPYLRLVRAPAVFSALGDPLAGALVAGGALPAARVAGLGSAAAALYLAGMALNDLADRDEDARERPQRPIPSGAVSPRAAAAVGIGLLSLGVAAARGARTGAVGPALACTVVAYDFALKSTAAGPVAMGAARALSLLMGARAAKPRGGVRAAAGAAALLGGYVAGLTLLARGETAEAGNQTVAPGVLIAGAAVVGALLRGGTRSLPWVAAVAALAGPAALRAARAPAPATVGPAVGSMIRAIPALDAALAAPRAPVRAALLALPLLALVRWGRSRIPVS